MSQFDAIERMLRARREALEQQESVSERPDTAEPAVSGVVSEDRPSTDLAVDPRAQPRRAPNEPDTAVDHGVRPRPWRIRRRTAFIACGVAATVLAAAGAIALAARPGTSHTASHTPSPPAATPDEIQAAQWVAANVGQDHVVACDVNLCALERGAGIPAASLVTVGSDITEVERADVVISTEVVRGEFGAQLAPVISPQPLASFGSGVDRVDVTPVALGGSGDYARRLTADRDARREVGTAMTRSHRITLLPPAAAALTDGLVDGRLCSLLTLISTAHTLTVASFGGNGPGAGPDIPEADVVISRVDGQPADGSAPQAVALRAQISAQLPPYRPMDVTPGSGGLKVSFSQPEPFGLIVGATP